MPQPEEQEKRQPEQVAQPEQPVHLVQPELPRTLLSLPDFLLHVILEQLTDADDLSAAAASCSALRGLAGAATWPGIASCAAPRGWSPALPGSLRWTAAHCPQLRDLDLSGATACCDSDLLPLSQLSQLTRLSLAGLWRVTGASEPAGSASGGRRRGAAPAGGAAGQLLDVLGAILGANCGLLALDLSGTAVPVGSGLAAALAQLMSQAPNATKAAYGLQQLRLAGCQRAGGGGQPQQGALREVLLQCPALWRLDVSGCWWLTGNALPQSGDALATAVGMLPMRFASFAGCELLGGVGWLLGEWQALEALDLSGTAVDVYDVEQIAAGCHHLQSLKLSGCCRIRGPGLLELETSLAVQTGQLAELGLNELAWVEEQHLGLLLRAVSSGAGPPLRLDLSGCGGLTDSTLLQLLPAGRPQGLGVASGSSGGGSSGSGCTVQELRVAGSSRLTAAALAKLAAAGTAGSPSCASLLCRLQHLDVSHVLCLGRPGSGTAASSSTSSSSPAAQALTTLLAAAGSSLRTALLDGCFAGGGLLPQLVRCCPGVERLSLVGCSGLTDADLAQLAGLKRLRDLAVGGSSLAWHEHRTLTGLAGLTRLRIARRPFLTDVQLAPVLAASRGSLRQLELAGCAALGDQVLLHLLAPAPPSVVPEEWHGEQEQQHQQDGQQGQHQQQEGAGQRRAAGQGDEPRQAQAQPPRQSQPDQQVQQAQQARQVQLRTPLEHLHLVCCERMSGCTLRQLRHLRSLRLPGCPAIREEALQAAAISCTRLTLLELPSHVRPGSIPVPPPGAASHLRGLQLLGGLDEGGRGGRRGSWSRRGGGR